MPTTCCLELGELQGGEGGRGAYWCARREPSTRVEKEGEGEECREGWMVGPYSVNGWQAYFEGKTENRLCASIKKHAGELVARPRAETAFLKRHRGIHCWVSW